MQALPLAYQAAVLLLASPCARSMTQILAMRGLVGAAAMTVFYESLLYLPLSDSVGGDLAQRGERPRAAGMPRAPQTGFPAALPHCLCSLPCRPAASACTIARADILLFRACAVLPPFVHTLACRLFCPYTRSGPLPTLSE